MTPRRFSPRLRAGWAAPALALVAAMTGCGADPPAGTGCPPAAGDHTLRHRVAGNSYSAVVHQPPAGVGSTPRPVVVDLHGLGSDGPGQARLSGFRELADEEGFVAVNPSGLVGALGARGWELTLLDGPDRDDVAYVAQLVDTLLAEECADPDRVYVAGFSNGGFLASELACRLPDRLAAVGAVAGLSWVDGCAPTRPVPLLAVHGTGDPVVPFDGGGRSLLVGPQAPAGLRALLSQSIPAELAQSAAAAACAPHPVRTQPDPGLVRTEYRRCRNGAERVLYAVGGGGHVWPRGEPGGLDATALLWDFFSRHAR